jgi:hypothetical protein
VAGALCNTQPLPPPPPPPSTGSFTAWSAWMDWLRGQALPGGSTGAFVQRCIRSTVHSCNGSTAGAAWNGAGPGSAGGPGSKVRSRPRGQHVFVVHSLQPAQNLILLCASLHRCIAVSLYRCIAVSLYRFIALAILLDRSLSTCAHVC